jgi:hypothetical protein
MLKSNRGGNTSEMIRYKIYKADELRGKMIETYYERKYPDKYTDLDWDLMDNREQNLLMKSREDLRKTREAAEKLKLPLEESRSY